MAKAKYENIFKDLKEKIESEEYEYQSILPKVIVGNIESDVKEHLYRTAEALDIKILAMETMPDHIHMLIECKPQCRISDAIKVFKGNTARWLFLTHPEIKTKLWGGHLWNPSYFVATVSERTKEQITNYISSQKEK
ncbi:IS200/IS605 family transposase [Butyrivibrio fibrisolvens]|uniref:IS200/IS605 family transposase n=1 Tax=Butyrivibrio fibrisolvens TaxID=831 RepID=UPI00040AF409|nr:IS200/IS605 family transposase [Butyrivibrio fibrisolvens]